VIVPNIGPRGQRQRLRFGAICLAIGIAGAVLLIASGAPRGARATLFLPLWLAGLGYFQARDKT
jgi:hypothetical protein